MRTLLAIAAVALVGFGCSDSSPTAPLSDDNSDLSGAQDWWNPTYQSFSLAMAGAEDSGSEAWGIFQVRVGLAPPNPCSFFARRFVSALTVCGIIYNPVEERLDAVTFEVMEVGAEGPVVLRGFVSAPPNPCNIAILRGVLPAELGEVESLVAILETDVGEVVPDGPDWPGAFPAAPPNPCSLTVTLG